MATEKPKLMSGEKLTFMKGRIQYSVFREGAVMGYFDGKWCLCMTKKEYGEKVRLSEDSGDQYVWSDADTETLKIVEDCHAIWRVLKMMGVT